MAQWHVSDLKLRWTSNHCVNWTYCVLTVILLDLMRRTWQASLSRTAMFSIVISWYHCDSFIMHMKHHHVLCWVIYTFPLIISQLMIQCFGSFWPVFSLSFGWLRSYDSPCNQSSSASSKTFFTLAPVFTDVSMYGIGGVMDWKCSSASSVGTCRSLSKSILFPTAMIPRSFVLSFTQSIYPLVSSKEQREVTEKPTTRMSAFLHVSLVKGSCSICPGVSKPNLNEDNKSAEW